MKLNDSVLLFLMLKGIGHSAVTVCHLKGLFELEGSDGKDRRPALP